MSKLIELIRKLGQQSQQPLGFGALSAASEPSPTMILIGRTSASAVADELESVEGDVVDAVILDAEGAVSAGDSDALEGLVWGVGPGPLSDADVETLVSAGCDFFVIDPDTAPAAVASQPDAATIVTLSEPADRETSQALRALGVDGSLSAPPAGLKEIAYRISWLSSAWVCPPAARCWFSPRRDIRIRAGRPPRCRSGRNRGRAVRRRAGVRPRREDTRAPTAQTLPGAGNQVPGSRPKRRLNLRLSHDGYCPYASLSIRNAGSPAERILSCVVGMSYSTR